MKIVELYGKRIVLLDKFVSLGTQEPYINVSPSALTFTYESGITHTFNITSNTDYTVTPSDSWIGVDYNSGSSNLTVTVEMMSENSGLTSRVGAVTVQSLTLLITKTVTIVQDVYSEPELFIMTEGGVFDGELV
jgi:hypothetical protein